MIRLFKRDGQSFDPGDVTLTVSAETPHDSIFPWDDLGKMMLLDGEWTLIETTWNGMPVRGIRWTDTSGLAVELPLPVEVAEEVGRALAGQKVKVAKEMPSQLWTPP